MRQSIYVQQVAITIWCLATPAEYRTIAHLFGVARSTVCEIIHNTCSAIVENLMSTYIRFPRCDKLEKVTEHFLTKWGVPQCVGAIDGCHVPIAAPVGNHSDYYNCKEFYSMLLQGIVDTDYCFLDICIGWPGSVHDACVFVHSPIYIATEEDLLPDKPMSINGVNVPLFLIGDSAYPLHTWLMKPLPQSGILTNEMKQYNYRICRARIVVENAYGRLKACCQRLMKRNDMHVNHIPNMIAAACILHNLCEIHNEYFNDAWLQDISDSNYSKLQLLQLEMAPATNPNVRDALVYYFKYN